MKFKFLPAITLLSTYAFAAGPFAESDFYWDASTTPHKAVIMAGVNKIARENSRCTVIDPSSAYISTSRGTAADPVFFVTCGEGSQVFNEFFSKSDVQSGAPQTAAAHINKDRAIALCREYAESSAANPETVSFSVILDLAVAETPNGRTRVMSSFTAENAFGGEAKFNIDCLLSSDGMIEASIDASE